ncbi:MAG TPA: DEAD/DEAH box helicase [Syntrophales bacterium]|nr:DEAD/DEAH box helicase [Syntrophales bacterium]
MDFQELGLNEELVRAVKALGFVNPMPIQEQAIPVLLDGSRDVVGSAQTGTGKTGAFGLPLLQLIDRSVPHPQALVLCPTRELCIQITNDIKQFSLCMEGVRTAAVYGGASIEVQIRQIKRGAQIIVATPGRLNDLLRRKAVKMEHISVAVLDEADEMLNMGFKEDIDLILATLPPHRRIWLFSATMPSGVAAIATKYLTDPVKITVNSKQKSPEKIEHTCYTIQEKDRYEALKRILDFSPGIFGLVFCRTRKETQDVAARLIQDGYDSGALHGELSQAQRDSVMQRFRQASIRILVATDVAARGLDVNDITHVIHYNLPNEPEMYIHRSGRTARAGKHGSSIALINVKEKYRLQAIEKRLKIQFDFEKVPDGPGICKKQLLSQIEKIVDTKVNDADIAEYLPVAYEALRGIDKNELIKRLVSSEFTHFIDYYRHSSDINVKPLKKAVTGTGTTNPKTRVKDSRTNSVKDGIKDSRKDTRKDRKAQRFFINIGRLDKMNEGSIVKLICDHSDIRASMIGQVNLKRSYSFFEVENRVAGMMLQSIRNAKFYGREVMIREVFDKKIPPSIRAEAIRNLINGVSITLPPCDNRLFHGTFMDR